MQVQSPRRLRAIIPAAAVVASDAKPIRSKAAPKVAASFAPARKAKAARPAAPLEVAVIVPVAAKPARAPAKAKAVQARSTPKVAAKVAKPAPKPAKAAAAPEAAKPASAKKVGAAPAKKLAKAPAEAKASAASLVRKAPPSSAGRASEVAADAAVPARKARRPSKAASAPPPPSTPPAVVSSGRPARRRATSTVLGDFGRQVRKEPLFYIYKQQIWFESETLSEESVLTWLRKRYTDGKSGHRYRLNTYRHKDGNRYVDNVMMETLTDNDMVELRLRGWLWTRTRVLRGNRVLRRKLTSVQRKNLLALISKVQDDFYDSL